MGHKKAGETAKFHGRNYLDFRIQKGGCCVGTPESSRQASLISDGRQ